MVKRSFIAWDVWEREKRDARRRWRREERYPAGGQPKKDKVTTVADALKSWERSIGGSLPLKEAMLDIRWAEIVGETIASHAVVVKLERDKLMVRVDDATWRHQLLYMKPNLLKRISAEMEGLVIKDIIFV